MRSRCRRCAALSLLLVLLFLLLPQSALATEYDASRPESLTAAQLRGQSALLIDAQTGDVLYEKNADDMRYPASTTKIMTILLGIMMGDSDAVVTVSENAVNLPPGSSSIPLVAGEQLPLSDLLRMTMVSSGNDGAVAIAEHISGSESAFVALMNDAARNFGATNTHFVNASGLHDENHYSNARDLALIARIAMQDATFREIAELSSYTLPKSDWSAARKKTARNSVLMVPGEDNTLFDPDITGIKTGFTNPAGYCFVGSASRGGVELISVVLKASGGYPWTDTTRLMAYGFSRYVSTSVEALYRENPKSVDISGYALDDPELGRLEMNIRKLDPLADDHLVGFAGQTESWMGKYNTRTSINFTRMLEAPIEAGEVMGTMTYTPEGPDSEPVEYELLAGRSIARRIALAPSLDDIRTYTEADPNPFPRFSLEFLALVLLPLAAVVALSQLFYKLLNRKRKPKLSSRRTRFETRHYR